MPTEVEAPVLHMPQQTQLLHTGFLAQQASHSHATPATDRLNYEAVGRQWWTHEASRSTESCTPQK